VIHRRDNGASGTSESLPLPMLGVHSIDERHDSFFTYFYQTRGRVTIVMLELYNDSRFKQIMSEL